MTKPIDRKDPAPKPGRNRAVLLACAGTVAAMVALTYASVPLYDLFCRVTGYGGMPRVAATSADEVLERTVTIRFDASVARGMPWAFRPVERTMEVKLGEDRLAFYRAHNQSGAPITGTATYNVTPEWAASYFVKVDCFCFVEQTLDAGEAMDMPVSFYVDPDILKERDARWLDTITLSYTFFPAARKQDGAPLAAAGESRAEPGG